MALELVSPVDEMMQASEDSNQIVKCGEITLINKRKISFTCNFCVREVFSIGSFVKHILRKHLTFSRADIDALMLGAKNKQSKYSEQDTSIESIDSHLNDENDADYFYANNMEDKIVSNDEQNEQILMESSELVNHEVSFNTSDCTPSTLAENEYPSPTNIITYAEEDNEEIELLNEFFEKVPTTTEEEIQSGVNDFQIDVPSNATSDQEIQTEVNDFQIDVPSNATSDQYQLAAEQDNVLETSCNETKATKLVYVTQGTTALQRINTIPKETHPPMTMCNKQILLIYKPVHAVTKPLVTKAAITPNIVPKTTNELNPMICKICKKVFKSQELLKIHSKCHVLKAKTFTCEHCDQKFSCKSNLNVHVKRHLGIKPYSCSFCEKAFTSSTEVKLHMLKHTGSKMFKCAECDQQFSRQFQLKLHSRRHFNERPYACDTCGNRFFDSQRLRAHEAIHSKARPFSCDKCEASFKRLKSLREHSKLHLDVKTYSCKICGKTFAQYSGMYAHTKTHEAKGKKERKRKRGSDTASVS